MSNLIQGIHHIAIKCNGYEHFQKTVAFYRDLLGLKVERSWGEGASSAIMLDTAAGLFEIFANGDDKTGEGGLRHVALATSDTDTCVKLVREAGYEITMEPTDIVIASPVPYPARIAFCNGPAGEIVEFFCVK